MNVVVYSGLDNSPPNFPGLYWNLSGGFSSPVIDDAGNIAFVGTIFGDGITPANNRVMWYGAGNTWTQVARNGDAALPGLPGLNLLAIPNSHQPISPNGTLLVTSTLAGAGVTTANDTAFWCGPVGNPGQVISQENTTIAPNTGGAVLSNSMLLGVGTRMNNAGQVLFSSNLTGGTVTAADNFAVYLGTSSGITEVTRKGNPIPGAPALPDPSGPFMTPDSFGMQLNGAGEVASTGTLVAGSLGGVTGADDKVVWTTVGGAMRIVAREGDPVPGMNLIRYRPNSVFNMATMGLTNSGKIVFNPIIDNIAPGTDVTTANDTCWLVDDDGVISMVVREGDTIDGETFNFAQSSGGMMVNNNDRVAIAGTVTGTTGTGRLWTGPLGGPYTRIVQQGVTAVPGDPTSLLDFNAGGANLALNSAGQMVFTSNLIGPGVTPAFNDRGLFGWSEQTGLILIARSGVTAIDNILEVAQVTLIGSTGFTGENTSLTLADSGWLVFRAQDVKGFQAMVRTKPFETCPANTDADSDVDVDDLLAVINSWGQTGSNLPADANYDNVVDVDDLLAVINAWGNCPALP